MHLIDEAIDAVKAGKNIGGPTPLINAKSHPQSNTTDKGFGVIVQGWQKQRKK